MQESLIFGKNAVFEAIKNNQIQANKIFISDSLTDKKSKDLIILYAKEKKIPYSFVPGQKLDKITSGQNHQGIVLTISPIQYLSVKEIIKTDTESKVILIAHEIEDNHNLGAMIRTFVAGGGKKVILTGKQSVGLNYTTAKTSSGALFKCLFARAVNCINVLNELKKNNFWILLADNSKDAKSIYEIDFPEKIAIVMGNEHHGVGALIKKNSDFLVKIPIAESIDSLNVSVAFGIIFFEVLRKAGT